VFSGYGLIGFPSIANFFLQQLALSLNKALPLLLTRQVLKQIIDACLCQELSFVKSVLGADSVYQENLQKVSDSSTWCRVEQDQSHFTNCLIPNA